MTHSKPTLYEIENAFQPAKEILDVDRFAGRTKPVQEIYLGLIAEGANIAIVGNRGIGKTSLARQVQNLGSGSNDLLKRLTLKYDHRFDYQTIYLACGKSITNLEDLLSRLITSNQCLGPWLYDLPKISKMVRSLSPKLTAKLFGLGGEVGAQHAVEESREFVSVPQSIDAIFENIVNDIVDEKLTRDGLLVVVDEFDQIQDPSGFGLFLKALATNAKGVKFCIVGVAKDIQELMREHESSDRLFAGTIVSLDPMSESELREIIRIAETQIGKYVTFDEGARERLAKLAQGHPYMVHLIGKFALRSAFDRGARIISTEDIEATLRSIAEDASDPVLEGRYRKAIASSAQRESVLKALAKTEDSKGEVWTTDAYKASMDQGVDNPSQYVGQLVTAEYGAEIEKIRERYYRFKDSLFAAYVKARPRLRGSAPGDDEPLLL